MSAHLLALADLHAAAPGVLDVIFGRDGDFEGAPEWRCPIWDSEDGPDGDWMGISRHARHPIADQFNPLDTMFFDVRIPSVAARLAGLCARSIQMHAADPGPWYWTARGISAEFGQYGGFERWEVSDGMLRPLHLIDSLTRRKDRLAPILPADAASSRPAFLASLTLALAPRIAALGGMR